jgi:hypothetical protein
MVFGVFVRQTRGSALSDKEHGVLGLRLLLGDHGAADGHDQGNDAVDAFGGLVLGGLQIAGGILGDGNVAAIQRVTRLP